MLPSSVLFPLTVLGSPKDLVTKDVTETSFAVSWTAALGNVRSYWLKWKSLYTEETGEKSVPGDVTATVLDGLTPETRYQVSVYATYDRGEGEPLVGAETTDGKSLHLPNVSTTHRLTVGPALSVSLCLFLSFSRSLALFLFLFHSPSLSA